MKRPRARAGRTPISSSVRIVEPPELVGEGGGEPWVGAGTATAAGALMAFIDVVSGPVETAAGLGRTATPPTGVAAGPAGADAFVEPEGAARRCGSFAIWASRSRTLCGRCAGSLARTFSS